ncbi:hypothetical protein LY11_03161 [Pedobacter cryoconitis]|uniref:Uncharacterized protein n=1 Tax=Pedobacter cryoconitis TaxID=188932 RepID=A0A327STA5_9SPHI|nr:hypothetical protein LY11_03161 [Pedobacter cryoconitis]
MYNNISLEILIFAAVSVVSLCLAYVIGLFVRMAAVYLTMLRDEEIKKEGEL